MPRGGPRKRCYCGTYFNLVTNQCPFKCPPHAAPANLRKQNKARKKVSRDSIKQFAFTAAEHEKLKAVSTSDVPASPKRIASARRGGYRRLNVSTRGRRGE